VCGITGVLNLANQEPIDPNCLLEANNALYHRGPDDEGMFVEPNIGLAVRRLSIIDLAGGHQPMSNEDGTVHIVYNGETYNYRGMRAELESLGHQFRTNSDTEVILHAYEQWGPEGCLERLRGMFAFAIWDSRAQSLLLGRDRMGIKPLYFAEYNGRLYFASEIRSLLLHSNMPREVALTALDAFLSVGFVTAPHTIFKGIKKLPPAHYLVVKNGQVSVHKYWELSYRTIRPGSEAEVVEEFYELLRESVEMRLMSEVPLGALLSGGIDSAMVTALMQKAIQIPVTTISIGFEATSYDEAQPAAATARALGTDHHPIRFHGNSLDEYPKAMYYLEEPVADPIFVSVYYLYQACRQQGLTVVLVGEGADELLGGYYWHRGEIWIRPLLKLPHYLRIVLAEHPAFRARGEAGARMARVLGAAPSAIHTRYQTWLSIGDPDIKNGLFSSEVKLALNDSPQSILESWADHLPVVAGKPELNQMLWVQSRTRMVDLINHWVDRMSMAHSVEARPPFLDHRLWEFCASIPHNLKIRGSYLNPTEKYILRQAGQNVIPEATRLRKKKGLAVPHALWLAQSHLPDWAESALSEAQLKRTGLFDPAAVSKLRREHQAGALDRATLLMGVLAIQTWAHIFLESPLN
jgi:asparagine synthase (glutamine-hydrolysing)